MSLFDSFQGEEAQSSAIDVLNNLLDPENIEMKTDLNMTQIRILCQLKWFSLLDDPKNKDREPEELVDELMKYFMRLMCSLERRSRGESIKGISEMKDKLLESMTLLQGMKTR